MCYSFSAFIKTCQRIKLIFGGIRKQHTGIIKCIIPAAYSLNRSFRNFTHKLFDRCSFQHLRSFPSQIRQNSIVTKID